MRPGNDRPPALQALVSDEFLSEGNVKAVSDHPRPSHGSDPASTPNRLGNGLSILLVDDNRKTAEGMATELRRYGHRVQIVPDEKSACKAALYEPPDSVLLDLPLPALDGCEVARRLQEPSSEKKPFFIALTDDTSEEARHRSRNAGIDLHLLKPVDTDLLRRVLQRFHRVIMPTGEWLEDINGEGREAVPAFIGDC